MRLKHYFPILDWGRTYTREALSNGLVAALIVTIMLIPQSLAYALLARLLPEAGIDASIVPILLYAVLGTSRALAVGPVAVVSLLTASATGRVAEQGTAGYATAALTLALRSGGILMLLGLLRLGFLANFINHPAISGFITASSILIVTSQLKHILGINAHGHTLLEMRWSLYAYLHEANVIAAIIGLSGAASLFWVRIGLKPLAQSLGALVRLADTVTKAGPVLVVFVVTMLTVWVFGLQAAGEQIFGDVPQGLPPFTLPGLSPDLIRALLVPALLISVLGFVESVSVAQTLAAKKGQRIDPDQELIGLGAANIGSSFTGGCPVTGGFARSIVNHDAGAETPVTGAYTAIGLAIAALALTPLIHYLPTATLAATIIVAVLSLVDLSVLRTTWNYSRSDFMAVAATILLTLGLGLRLAWRRVSSCRSCCTSSKQRAPKWQKSDLSLAPSIFGIFTGTRSKPTQRS